MFKRNIQARSRKHCCHGKAITDTYSECMSVALVIQHVMRMRPIILSSMAYPAVQCFFHIMSQEAQVSKKNIIGHKMCVSSFSTNFV